MSGQGGRAGLRSEDGMALLMVLLGLSLILLVVSEFAQAMRLESEGHRILRLNLGNPAPFGFEAPDEIVADMARQLTVAQGYSDSKGILPARRAVVQYHQGKGVAGIDVEDDLGRRTAAGTDEEVHQVVVEELDAAVAGGTDLAQDGTLLGG